MVAEPRRYRFKTLLLQSCLESSLTRLLLFARVEGQELVIQWLEGSLTPCFFAAWQLKQVAFWNTRNTIDIPNFDGTDANSESWRVKFEAYADLACMGAHLHVAAEQTAFIEHEGLDANRLLVSGKDRALFSTSCEGKAFFLWLVLRLWGLRHGECSRKSMGAKVEIAQQRS